MRVGLLTHLEACFDKMNRYVLFESRMTLFRHFSLPENEYAIFVIQCEFLMQNVFEMRYI